MADQKFMLEKNELTDDPFTTGVLDVFVKNGENFKSVQLIGKMDPFVRVQCGNFKHDSPSLKDSDTRGDFNEKCQIRLNGNEEEFKIKVINENAVKNEEIGRVTYDIADLLKGDRKEHSRTDNLVEKGKSEARGQLTWTVTHHPPAWIKIEKCSGLKSVQLIGDEDIFVRLEFNDKVYRTMVKENSGVKEVNFPAQNQFPFNLHGINQEEFDSKRITVKVLNKNKLLNDDVAKGILSLAQINDADIGESNQMPLEPQGTLVWKRVC
jgi:hypothetical protein